MTSHCERLRATFLSCTPGSSAPSESMFSDSGHTVGKKRTRLLDAKVDYLTFLGSWLKHKMKKNKK